MDAPRDDVTGLALARDLGQTIADALPYCEQPRPNLEYVMPMIAACDNCGTPTPIYRLAAVILDGHVAQICPRCTSTEQDRIDLPYAPRSDQGAIQPSTSRDAW